MEPPKGLRNHTSKKNLQALKFEGVTAYAPWNRGRYEFQPPRDGGMKKHLSVQSGGFSCPKRGQTLERLVRLKKFLWNAETFGDGFGSEITAANRALHCGGPAGGGVITGQRETWDAGALRRAPVVD